MLSECGQFRMWIAFGQWKQFSKKSKPVAMKAKVRVPEKRLCAASDKCLCLLCCFSSNFWLLSTFWHPYLRLCLNPSDLSSGRSTRPTILSMSTTVAVCCLPFHNCRRPETAATAAAAVKASYSALAANWDSDTDSAQLWNKIRDWGVAECKCRNVRSIDTKRIRVLQ